MFEKMPKIHPDLDDMVISGFCHFRWGSGRKLGKEHPQRPVSYALCYSGKKLLYGFLNQGKRRFFNRRNGRPFLSMAFAPFPMGFYPFISLLLRHGWIRMTAKREQHRAIHRITIGFLSLGHRKSYG